MLFNHSNLFRILIVGASIAITATCVVAQPNSFDPVGANAGAIFRLGPDSTFQEGCFPPCMCPILAEQQVLGTLTLQYTGVQGSVHEYVAQDVNWYTPYSNNPDRIVGRGKYQVGSPDPLTVMQHRMELDLQVGLDAVQHFDSGWMPWNSGTIEITISMNGAFCWDRVFRIAADMVPGSDLHRYELEQGSTFQRGCIDGLCDCAVGPQLPMQGTFALVLLQSNPLFQLFAVVDFRGRVMNANSATGIPLSGYGLYRVGGEVAVQQQMQLSVAVADEEPQRYDSGLVVGGGQFPLIDVVTRTHTNCLDTILHLAASPTNGDDVCGGIMGVGCPGGEFCKLPTGHCCCDFQGVCTPIPSACPEYVDPVCGCDGVTYVNPCLADAAGQSIDYWGACRTACGPNAQFCQDGEFCKFPVGSCGASGEPGLCTATPGGCPDVWDPVCGCDGITYGNECEADAAGVSVRFDDVCADPCQPTPDGFGCTSCFSLIPEDVCRASILHLDIQGGAITTLDCDCMNMNACHIEFGNASPFAFGYCPNGETCEVVRRDSDNDGFDDTFWAQCMSSNSGACCLDIDDGPIRYDTCVPRTESACEADGGIFSDTNLGCEATQACCLGNAQLCADLHPVCCQASLGVPQGPGTNCQSHGCGGLCGGIAGLPCADATQFCKLPIGQCCCDHFGVCTPTGGNCPAEWDPVCGCDGVTYGNTCEADAAGVSIDYLGICGEPYCIATRTLDDGGLGHCGGYALTVRINLQPPANTVVIALEDVPPPGWTVGSISHGGIYDATNHKVKWGPLFAPFPAELAYLTTPANDTASPPCFAGTVSVDGVNEPTCGTTCLEPCCPRMVADMPHEACDNCPVTDCNSCDASICGDARIHLCEVVGYACAWLHGCNDDLAGMTRAAFIWRTGECYCWDGNTDNWFPTDCPESPNSGCCGNSNRFESNAGTNPRAVLSMNSILGRGMRHGSTKLVQIDLEIPDSATAMALEVDVPAGWKVTDISDGGQWDAGSRKVKWGVFYEDLSRIVGFTAHGPGKMATSVRNGVSQVDRSEKWGGEVSVDGINQPISIR